MYKIWSISLNSYMPQLYETAESAREKITKHYIFVDHFNVVEEKDWEQYEKEHKKIKRRRK